MTWSETLRHYYNNLGALALQDVIHNGSGLTLTPD